MKTSVTKLLTKLSSAQGRYYCWYYFLRKIGIFGLLSDDKAIPIEYRANTGHKLDLGNPSNFNEKLQWLKLNDHNPLYTTIVDKYLVKDYVSDKWGG